MLNDDLMCRPSQLIAMGMPTNTPAAEVDPSLIYASFFQIRASALSWLSWYALFEYLKIALRPFAKAFAITSSLNSIEGPDLV